MTRHALSRCAQRFGLRRSQHIINATCNIWLTLINEFGIDKERWYSELFPTLTHTRIIRYNDAVSVVVQRYHDPEGLGRALKILTVVPTSDEPMAEVDCDRPRVT